MIDDDTIQIIKAVGWTIAALAIIGVIGIFGSVGYAIYAALGG
jgi:hypothetical protein